MTRFRQRLDRSFHERLHADLRGKMAARGIGLLLLDTADDVLYAAGFAHRPTERPVVLALTAGDAVLLVPELERAHARSQDVAAELLVYFEFPGVERPLSILPRRLGRIDGDIAHGSGMASGRAAELAALFPRNRVLASDIVSVHRQIKYPEEIVLHREAARISDEMVRAGVALLVDALRSGKDLPTEIEMERHVTRHALDLMEGGHADILDVPVLAGGLVNGGPKSAFPHGIGSGRRFLRGESLILSLGCRVGGRAAESERTFVLGDPRPEHERCYRIAQEAQRIGTAALVAGAGCASADRAAQDYLRAEGMAPFVLHRLGHGMGVAFHEPPWIEAGDPTPLAPGMVCSSEPAVYVPGLGGFRLADTVLITAAGPESLTRYPRDFGEIVLA